MQIHPGKPWNLRGAATEKTLVGPTIVANRPGDIRRCFPRLRCVLLAKCTAVIVLMSSFFSGSVELRTGCCATSRCINWDRYYRIAVFFGWLWGCGYFELLHGQIGMLDFNAMEMRCSSHFNMNIAKIPQSFLVNIYHHPPWTPINSSHAIATKYGPFLSIPHPPNPCIFDSGSSTCGA